MAGGKSLKTTRKELQVERNKQTGEKGRRCGESHPNARYSDAEIELMRTMREELGYGYRRLARIWECSRGYMRDVLTYRRRCA